MNAEFTLGLLLNRYLPRDYDTHNNNKTTRKDENEN